MADRRQRRVVALMLPLRLGADRRFALGAIDRAARDEHHARQHPRRREARHQRQRAIDRAQPFLAPRAVGEAVVMPPVVGLERGGTTRRRLALLRSCPRRRADSRAPPRLRRATDRASTLRAPLASRARAGRDRARARSASSRIAAGRRWRARRARARSAAAPRPSARTRAPLRRASRSPANRARAAL